MTHLICLNANRPVSSCRSTLHPAISKVVTSLIVPAWSTALAPHPDRAFADYIVRGLNEGFRIGYKRGTPLRSAKTNMLSASQQPGVVDDYLSKELSLGRFIGPLTAEAIPSDTHLSRFGVIPKGHNSGKWRLITDLSFPHGQSVNDGIDPALCSLSYTSVETVATLLAKVDIESASRLIPVHPDDRTLLGVQWQGRVYIDPMLPFGLRSAPKIFNAVADALQWYLRLKGIPHIEHYLDDFIIVATNDTALCQHYVDLLNGVCGELGVPIADHKRDGPTTCL